MQRLQKKTKNKSQLVEIFGKNQASDKDKQTLKNICKKKIQINKNEKGNQIGFFSPHICLRNACDRWVVSKVWILEIRGFNLNNIKNSC